jgi:hypothetical protein
MNTYNLYKLKRRTRRVKNNEKNNEVFNNFTRYR